MYVIICFVRDHDTRFSRDFLHPALHNTQGDLYNTYQPRGKQKQSLNYDTARHGAATG